MIEREGGGMEKFEPIAIIGMRGRFPGAPDIGRFWENLRAGVESITFFSTEEMRAAGIPDHISSMPGYVNAGPLLDDVDRFDAEFFGFSARDASLTDPQHRLFLETSWEALEDAGYDHQTYPGDIGVFGGCEISGYLYQLYQNRESLGYLDGMQLMVTNDKDHLCTQVSYRLDLTGPSVVVQSTCSTSLVAVSLACESIHAGRCDMALAGGVTVRIPQRGGYLYTPGSILSPDGHCRPFDAEAQGTIVGSGVGLVLLKKLEAALRDGDGVRAVILGVGINNDGQDKVGYTAPSYRGQSEAIRAAHEASGVSADTIGFVEAHGTGTILGDPIEVSALTQAFRAHTQRRGYCAIGSVKSNVGHLSCAAGVTGLIKTVLALEHGAIPPTVHYEKPNPALDLVDSPFFVTKTLTPWSRNGGPRRAGVSSFGVGGTNAHLVVEEAPRVPDREARRSHELITLSARTPEALDRASVRLGEHLETHPGLGLADVAFTLHVGRRAFRHRRAVVARKGGAEELAATLRYPERLVAGLADSEPKVVFMFPGQGAQYPDMARDLYRTEPVVRRVIDRCAAVLEADLEADLRDLVFPSDENRARAGEVLEDTRWAQPALFTIEYALAELWISWGIRPAAVIGHSVGEFVAATLAEVLSLEDALGLIARRGRLISELPRGSMLSVMTEPESVAPFLDGEVSLAAVNAPGLCVLSGPDRAIERLESVLSDASIAARRLQTSHAFHSPMMEPALEAFERLVAGVRLARPTVPMVATATGEWADAEVATPGYWSGQLRDPVRFERSLRAVLADAGPVGPGAILLEVGPGRTLTTFAAQITSAADVDPVCLRSLPGPNERTSDEKIVLEALGGLWMAGANVEWQGYHAHEHRVRVSLPTYPFERRSYWIGTPPDAATEEFETRDTSSWFYRPGWEEADPVTHDPETIRGSRILVFDEEEGLGERVARRLRDAGAHPIVVRRGGRYQRGHDDTYAISPSRPDDFRRLAGDVCSDASRLAGVVDCWSARAPGDTSLDEAAHVMLLGPMRLAKYLSGNPTVRPLPLVIVARGTTKVRAADPMDPARALGAGTAKVIPQEHPGLRIAHMDVDDGGRVPDQIVAELAAGVPEPAVAARDGRRYLATYEAVEIPSAELPEGLPERPVVMMTGGVGHIGLALSEALFRHLDARLILVSRSGLPAPEGWAAHAEDPTTPPDRRRVLSRLAELREEGAEVLVVGADLNEPEEIRRGVEVALQRFGHIDVVVHGAGRVDAAAFASVAETGLTVVEAQFSPKLRGLLALMEALEGHEPDRWILHSSISSVLGGLGLGAYAGVNAMLDALALAGGEGWLSIGWDAWDNAAEAHSPGMPVPIHPPEGADAFLRLLGVDLGPHALVVVNDLGERIDSWVRQADPASDGAGAQRHERPNLATAYLEPRGDTERALAEIWAEHLGLETVGVHDRFMDLGGHSLLAVQVASEIRDRFQVEVQVLQLFQAPTIAELAKIVDQRAASPAAAAPPPMEETLESDAERLEAPELEGDSPGVQTKASYRAFYDDVSSRLETTGVGDASFFLNYGYVSLGDGDEARHEVLEGTLNPTSMRLAFELVGDTDLEGKQVLDVGCGRGGTVAVLAERYGAVPTGVDLSPKAIGFCRKAHAHLPATFEVGDAERLPFDDGSFEAVTNIESSHTYPNLRAFLAEVRRILSDGGLFLHTDLLPVQRWAEVRALLEPLGFTILSDRHITPNVLASCDRVAADRTGAFGRNDAMIENFLAVPGSPVYEQMSSGAWEYRIVRSRLGS